MMFQVAIQEELSIDTVSQESVLPKTCQENGILTGVLAVPRDYQHDKFAL